MSDLKPCPFCGGEALKMPSGKVTCKDFCRSFHNRTIPESDWNTRSEIQFNGDTVKMPKSQYDLLVARVKELEVAQNKPDTILAFVDAARDFGQLSGSDIAWLNNFACEYIEQFSEVA